MYGSQNNVFNNENSEHIISSLIPNNINPRQLQHNLNRTQQNQTNQIGNLVSNPIINQSQNSVRDIIAKPGQFCNDINNAANNISNTISNISNMPNQIMGNFNSMVQAPQNFMNGINNFSNMLNSGGGGGIAQNITQGIVGNMASGAMDVISAGGSGACGLIDGIFGFSEGQKRKTEREKQETERQRQKTMKIVKENTIEQGVNIDKQRKNITEAGTQQRRTMADGHLYQMEAMDKSQNHRMEFLNQTVEHKKAVMNLENKNNRGFEELKHGNSMVQMNTSIRGKKDIILLQSEKEKQNMMIKQMNNLYFSQKLFQQKSKLRTQDHQYNSQISKQNYNQMANIKNIDHRNRSDFSKQNYGQMINIKNLDYNNKSHLRTQDHQYNSQISKQNYNQMVNIKNLDYRNRSDFSKQNYGQMANIKNIDHRNRSDFSKQNYGQMANIKNIDHRNKSDYSRQNFLQLEKLKNQELNHSIQKNSYNHYLHLNRIYKEYNYKSQLDRQKGEDKIDEINTLYERKERLNKKEREKKREEMKHEKNLQNLKYKQAQSLQNQQFHQRKNLIINEHEEKRITELKRFEQQHLIEQQRFERKLYFNNLDAIKTNLPSLDINPMIFRKKYIDKIKKEFGVDEKEINWNTQNKKFSLYGFGGIGKTVLAFTYANQCFENPYEMIWWINAKNQEYIIKSLREIASHLGMKTALNDLEINILNYIKIKISQNKGKWLIIWDNLENMSFLNKYRKERFYPSFGGHILITSRNFDMPFPIYIDKFSKKEAIRLCTSITEPIGNNEYISMQNLVLNKFDRLPLAIVQACKYIRICDYKEYLNLRNFSGDRLQKKEKQINSYNRELILSKTLTKELDRIANNCEEAKEVANLISFIAPNNIPKIFLKLLVNDKIDLNEAISSLLEIGTIQECSRNYYKIHPIQQDILINRLKSQEKFNTIKKAAQIVTRAWNAFNGNSEIVPHLYHIWNHLMKELWVLNETIMDGLNKSTPFTNNDKKLTTSVSSFSEENNARALNNKGIDDEKSNEIKYSYKSSKIKNNYSEQYQELGEQMLPYIKELSESLYSSGKIAPAFQVLRYALVVIEKSKNKLSIAAEIYNLYGNILNFSNKKAEAIKYYEKAIQLLNKLFQNSNHLQNVDSNNNKNKLILFDIYNNLGKCLLECKENKKAKKAFNEALKLTEEKDSLIIANIYSQLAKVHYYLKNIKQSIEYYKKALKIFNQFKDYPNMANLNQMLGQIFYELSMDGLITQAPSNQNNEKQNYKQLSSSFAEEIYSNIGTNLDISEKYFEEAFNIYFNLNNDLGIAASSGKLGYINFDKKQYEKAAEYLEISWHKYLQIYDLNHSSTKCIWNKLDETYFRLSKNLRIPKSQLACKRGDEVILQELIFELKPFISKEVIFTTQNLFKKSCLHNSISSLPKNISYLICNYHGPYLNYIDADGKSLLHIVENQGVFAVLKENGINLEIEDLNGNTAYQYHKKHNTGLHKILNRLGAKPWSEGKETIEEYKKHNYEVNKLVFSPKNDILASLAKKGELIFWNYKNKSPIKFFSNNNLNTLAFDPYGEIFASNDNNKINLWDINEFNIIKTLEGINKKEEIKQLAFLNSSNHLISATENKIYFFDINLGKNIRKVQSSDIVTLKYNFPINSLILGHENGTLELLDLRINNSTTKTILNVSQDVSETSNSHTSKINTIAINQNYNIVASGSADCTISLNDLRMLKTIQKFKAHNDCLNDIEFSPKQSNVLASCSDDNKLKLWDININPPKKIFRIKEKYGFIKCLTFNKDTNNLVYGIDEIIKIWDTPYQKRN